MLRLGNIIQSNRATTHQLKSLATTHLFKTSQSSSNSSSNNNSIYSRIGNSHGISTTTTTAPNTKLTNKKNQDEYVQDNTQHSASATLKGFAEYNRKKAIKDNIDVEDNEKLSFSIDRLAELELEVERLQQSILLNGMNTNSDITFNEMQQQEFTDSDSKSNLMEASQEYIKSIEKEKQKILEYEELMFEQLFESKNIVENVSFDRDSEEFKKQMELQRLQTKLEVESVEIAIKKYRDLVDSTTKISKATGLSPVRDVMLQWNTALLEGLQTELAALKNSTFGKWLDIALGVPLAKSVIISLNYVLGSTIQEKSNFTTTARETLGVLIFAEYRAALLKKTDSNRYKYVMKDQGHTSYKRLSELFKTDIITLPDSKETIMQLGTFFLDATLKYCLVHKTLGEEFSSVEPAFYTDYKFHSGKRISRIRCHANVLTLIGQGHSIREVFNARLLPMVIKPLPWVNPTMGGYLHYKTLVMRTNGSMMQLSSLMDADLTHIFKGLNALGETPWVINDKLFNIIKETWIRGGGIGDIPSKKDIERPEMPQDYETNIESRKSFIKADQKVKALNSDLHSLRCDIMYKLDVAERFINNTIYFPHNLDFRGRSYPIPPHLNHLGSDFCRSLLKFEESKPLTKVGLNWLKIHLANLYGVDKIPFEDRIAFTENHLQDIFDSADNPLDGKRWWLQADKPWQLLAASIELTEALRSPNPEEYSSNLPIHQDGTCNGLQHYAALGGDELGAIKVNLMPSDRPQDVYTGVSSLVAQNIIEEAEKGDETAQKLVGIVDRKVVKQTVMTSVYGVTYIGARSQIEDQLQSKFTDAEEEDIFRYSAYITKLTFGSLDKMFLGARSIMSWLTKCASLIAKSGHCVSWTTPLGLPVVQPYRKGGRYNIKTLDCDFIVVGKDVKLPVDTNRQRSAFPPNYIHSLDSTHMFLTALACKEKKITYSSVHDSYWTHACTVDQMNDILREEFIELHKQPLLQHLLDWFKLKHPTINFPPIPQRGDLNLDKIRESKYFFH
ncbi:hypothetical protein CYY_001327 [Polysphondylium violaceum]|uniref:DNA-directed RNA polymerase n=1 Tax=Polysphondylium violaceum TaxID=133409 RepID=A0A8J4VAQ4_9MYCE|nr:hypothetical protein CYY_001327 [Polysphondylium violaceum]